MTDRWNQIGSGVSHLRTKEPSKHRYLAVQLAPIVM